MSRVLMMFVLAMLPLASSFVVRHSVPLHAQSSTSTSLSMAKSIKAKLAYVPCISLKKLPKPGSATSGVAGGLAICIAVDENGSVYGELKERVVYVG